MDQNQPASPRNASLGGPMTKKELKALRRLEKAQSQMQGKGNDMMKWIILAVGAVLFLAFFIFIIFQVKQSKNKPIEIKTAGWVKGSATASATLIEYGDFQCPACKAHEPLLRQAMKDFDGKLKLQFNHFPLTQAHPNAMLAARAAEAAGKQNKFWEMHDWLYDNQDFWAGLSAAEAEAKIKEGAKSFKLDMNKFGKDINDGAIKAKIEAEQSEGIDLGVSATPTFFLNNKKVEKTPADYAQLKKLIETVIK